jgi:hypothetical protein
VEPLASGGFAHRLLFSTGIEFAVVFREFGLNRERRAEPALSLTRPAESAVNGDP